MKLDNSHCSENNIVMDGDASLDDCLNNNLLLSPSQDSAGGEPSARKKPKLDLVLDFSPILSALERKKGRESLQIIPNLSEVLVTPVISTHQLKAYSTPKRKFNNWVKLSHPSRRFVNRSSPSWLFRTGVWSRERGRKCHQIECVESPVSRRFFKRTSELVLHRLWHHSKPSHSCDVCSSQFPHLYQALLHKIREHPEDHAHDQAQAILLPIHHDIQHHQQNQISDFSSAEDLLFQSQEESQSHHDHNQPKQLVFKSELS